MQVNGFKKSVFGGLKRQEVLSYLEQMSRDVEAKLRNKDDDIRELKKELSEKKDTVSELKQQLEDQKAAYEEKLSKQEKESSEKLEKLRDDFRREKEEMQEKLSDLKAQFTLEKEKIGRALVTAEEAANKLLFEAGKEAEEMIAEAKRKVDMEKERYKKQKADVTDFTYDIKKLMEKLTADLKEKLD